MPRRPKNQPYIYVRPDGVIEVRWTNPATGKRVTRIARDMAHAQELLVTIMLPPPPPPPPTLSAWVETWLALRVAQGSDPYTLDETYRRALRRVTDRIGSRCLTTITPVVLADLWISLAHDTTPSGRAGYAPSSIRLSRRILRLALEAAVEHDLIMKNPVRDRPPSLPPRDLDVSAERATRILQAARGTPAEAAVTLALFYGMRAGEVLGLRWVDVDMAAGVITVQGQSLPNGVYRPRTKSGKKRELPLIAPVARVLAGERRSPYVIPGRGQNARSRPGLRWAFLKALADAGLPPMRFHDLRHMTVTLLSRAGIDEPTRQEIVGHTSASVHGLYRHVSLDDKRDALEKLGEVLAQGVGLCPTP